MKNAKLLAVIAHDLIDNINSRTIAATITEWNNAVTACGYDTVMDFPTSGYTRKAQLVADLERCAAQLDDMHAEQLEECRAVLKQANAMTGCDDLHLYLNTLNGWDVYGMTALVLNSAANCYQCESDASLARHQFENRQHAIHAYIENNIDTWSPDEWHTSRDPADGLGRLGYWTMTPAQREIHDARVVLLASQGMDALHQEALDTDATISLYSAMTTPPKFTVNRQAMTYAYGMPRRSQESITINRLQTPPESPRIIRKMQTSLGSDFNRTARKMARLGWVPASRKHA